VLTVTSETLAEIALERLRSLTGEDRSRFRPGQLEAIRDVVADRARVLCVQRTGWGKSALYFVATALLREAEAGPTLIVSPLLALMRNQIAAAQRLGLRAHTINSTNREEWDDVHDRLAPRVVIRCAPTAARWPGQVCVLRRSICRGPPNGSRGW
jgi:ATP-dependent DNA helicase RecQ